mmetsp:Transcript_38440/g.115229  ORF Transcript_38440/g.115229 Transcript_38440/m.115229 type:complete len:1174 (-) Transcript_38440:230-3751(-)
MLRALSRDLSRRSASAFRGASSRPGAGGGVTGRGGSSAASSSSSLTGTALTTTFRRLDTSLDSALTRADWFARPPARREHAQLSEDEFHFLTKAVEGAAAAMSAVHEANVELGAEVARMQGELSNDVQRRPVDPDERRDAIKSKEELDRLRTMLRHRTAEKNEAERKARDGRDRAAKAEEEMRKLRDNVGLAKLAKEMEEAQAAAEEVSRSVRAEREEFQKFVQAEMDKQAKAHDEEVRVIEETVTEQEDEIDALRAQLEKVLKRADADRTKRRAEVSRAKEEAEKRIAERTEELKEEHGKLASALKEEANALQELVRKQHSDMKTKREREAGDAARTEEEAVAAREKLEETDRELVDTRQERDELKRRLEEAEKAAEAKREKEGEENDAPQNKEGNGGGKHLALKLEEAEEEHDLAIRAIQRVLADVTTEREERAQEYEAKIEELRRENEALLKSRPELGVGDKHTSKSASHGHGQEEEDDDDATTQSTSESTATASAAAGPEAGGIFLSEEELSRLRKRASRADDLERGALLVARLTEGKGDNSVGDEAIEGLLGDAEEEEGDDGGTGSNGSSPSCPLRALRRSVAVIRRKEAALADMRGDVSELREALAGKDQLVADLAEELREIQNEREASGETTEALRMERDEALAALGEMGDQEDGLRSGGDGSKEDKYADRCAELEAALERERARSKEMETQIISARISDDPSTISASLTIDRCAMEKLQKEQNALRKELQSKTSSLDTAKMMIKSLEEANGSQAAGQRTKLQERSNEVEALKRQVEAARKAASDMESKMTDLRRRNAEIERSERAAKERLRKQRAVQVELKAQVEQLAAARTVVKNVVRNGNGGDDGDEGAAFTEVEVTMVENVFDSITKSAMDLEGVGSGEISEDNSPHCNVPQQVKMEDMMRAHQEAAQKAREELEAVKLENEESFAECREEISRLREECAANNELLAKKESELHVLRESLNEPSTGYISDEDDEEFIDDDGTKSCVSLPTDSLELLLVQGNETVRTMTASKIASENNEKIKAMEDELESIRREKERAAKDRKKQEESLANAKMIISSLEQANNSMLEDLRSRLNDSNTAIVSLLDKSTKHEEANAKLQAKIEDLEKKRKEEKSLFEKEQKRVKEERLMNSCRIAAKDREVEQLRRMLESNSVRGPDTAEEVP